MRRFLFLCAVILLPSCVPTQPQPLPRKDYATLDTLNQLNDLNEGVFKYVAYCEKSGAAPAPAFIANYKYVLNRLLDEKIKVEGYGVKQASGDIVKRRAALKNHVDQAFKEGGCGSAMADKIAQHYKHFSNFTPQNIDRLVREGMSSPDFTK